MFQTQGSKYPPWSKKRKTETHTMAIKTSVELENNDSAIKKAVRAVRRFFKK